MRVIITGGTGLIGTKLTKNLTDDDHEVYVLSRNARGVKNLPSKAYAVQWDAKTSEGWLDIVNKSDAIVNLAGASIAEGRWTDASKKLILDSRTNAGAAVVEAVTKAENKPEVVIQASAVGYYGPRGDELLTEESSVGTGFPADVSKKWEPATEAVESLGVRRVVTRIGVVLSNHGGMISKLLLPFKMGTGGPMGDGKHYFPWVHIDDCVNALRFFIDNKETSGVYNITGNPVINKEFSQAFGKALNRPAFLPLPAFALETMFGEMSAVMLDSQRVESKRLKEAGFHFNCPDIGPALADIINRNA